MPAVWILAVIAFVVLIFIKMAIKVVPQQRAFIVERLGRFHAILAPGLNVIVPFIDRIAYKHSLKEIPLDVPSQVCITRDNTQLKVDGILYFQVTDPKRASYGTSDFILAISQLAQTTLRSVIGRMELDKTFEERDEINHSVVAALDEAAVTWGVKVLRYEIKDLVPPGEILHAMQRQITAEREKRALIAQSEGQKMEAINLAAGQREAAIKKSEGEQQSLINQSLGQRESAINRAQGEAEALKLVADATAQAIARVGTAVHGTGGIEAVNLRVAEQYIEAFAKLAKTGNTLIIPSNAADVSGIIATALSTIKQTGG